MHFDRGYLSPYFVTDPERMECVLEDPLILIHQQKIVSLKELVPFLEATVKTQKPLLIIAEDVEGDALASCSGCWNPKARWGSILAAHRPNTAGLVKVTEVPFDFLRKRVSVILKGPAGIQIVTKGAVDHVLEVSARSASGRSLDAAAKAELRKRHAEWAAEDIRVLAVATRELMKRWFYRSTTFF